MGTAPRRFASVSVLLAVVSSIAPTKDLFSQWRHYQRLYVQMIRNRPDADRLDHRFKSGINQIWIPEQHVVDRCSTCHVALQEPSLSDVRKEPFRPHPPMPHSLTEFGCVICHHGQGAATTVQEAHYSTKAWEQPILPARYTESSCGQCHMDVLKGTPRLNQGRLLLARYGCAHCHAITNAAGNLVGGDLAPELTRVGGKVSPDWLRRWLQTPQGYDPKTRMPRYRYDEKQVALLSSFLLSKKDDDFLANVRLPESDAQSVARGKKLVADYGCTACHRVNGVNPPESFAPDLSRIGSKPLFQVGFIRGMPETLPDYIAGKIHDTRAFGPALKMPTFSLSDVQVESLTTALLAQTDRAVTMPPELVRSTSHAKYHPGGDAGRLMEDLRCQSCHTINGNGGDMAPDLTFEGSAVQRTWLLDFMNNPNSLRPMLIRRMPKFNLSDAEIKSLSDYMLSAYQASGFDSQALEASALNADAAARGKQLFYTKYACQACHTADYKKDKGYVGPTLADAGDRLTPVWIYKWLKNPNALSPGTLMPNPNLQDGEARDLTAFLVTLNAHQKRGTK